MEYCKSHSIESKAFTEPNEATTLVPASKWVIWRLVKSLRRLMLVKCPGQLVRMYTIWDHMLELVGKDLVQDLGICVEEDMGNKGISLLLIWEWPL